jgi:hypothetical protein
VRWLKETKEMCSLFAIEELWILQHVRREGGMEGERKRERRE